MSRKKTYITLTDQFCGAGGSGSGAKRVLDKVGGKIALALNHWKLATETYETNHTDTAVDCTDISACDPRRYPSTDGLMTSPECTTHTPAGGNTHKALRQQMDMFNKNIIDAATERSRATMWDVCRFAEYHEYNFIIAENVVEAKTRWPLFDTWLQAMHVLGYKHKCVYLNSMFCHPTPQSRDRMYIVFWKKGNKAPDLEYTPKAWCWKCEKDVFAVQCWKNPDKKFGKYKQQYIYCCPNCTSIIQPYYHAAFNCIDWSDTGKKIGDRALKSYDKPYLGDYDLPLSPNSMKRIQSGLDKFGNQVLTIANYTPGYARPINNEMPSIRTKDSTGILMPFIIDDKQTTGVDFRVRGVDDVLPVCHTDPRMKLILPFVMKMENASNIDVSKSSFESFPTQLTRQTYALVSPFIVDGNFDAKPSRSSSIGDELPTQTTNNRTGITFPFIVESKGQSTAHSAADPLSCATTVSYHGIVSTKAWNSFLTYYNGHGGNKHISESAPTVATGDRFALVNYDKPKIEDCYYRMLKPQEIKLAMAFDKDYKILGSGKDQVKQLGNAVTPPAMEWLVKQCVDSLI